MPSYCGIVLFCLTGKVYSRVPERRFRQFVEPRIQGGLSLVTDSVCDIHGQDLKAQPGGGESPVWEPQNCISGAVCSRNVKRSG